MAKGEDCKSSGYAFVGSSPTSPTIPLSMSPRPEPTPEPGPSVPLRRKTETDMATRPPGGHPRSGPKAGATHEQIGRRERGERARRETLRGDDADETVIMYGWHTVTAALRNPARTIRKFLVTENAARKLTEEGIESMLEPEIVRPSAIAERLLPDAVHQGL